MGFVPVMWALWGASFLLMLGVSIIGARLTRNEEAQIFLSDSSNYAKSEQDAISATRNRIRPLKRIVMGLLGIMTLLVVAYYAVDIMHRF